ncbi:ADR085Wp [Eremothecium gossypii ATCC 10895]|uniref:ADR085Wp n=1 Tax=Eremothecium gossypii (strain ATCC 10895 / CBS 109.51 / FGSC 9923 / NRRL Y-1056) TaxID=284811 RepID=Q75AH4_EREGS|nr:ADR085Wp [Eremothecium gossypii ATCC 10895]AAS52005.1 ADR085Wp [Eremothecium gossypii ATCC 10895]AEY96304.1 FADR085Wp [Eremothecium gossypii FDAG1]
MNVLVYNGPGASPESVRQTLLELRRLLEPHYAVSTVQAKALSSEPWQGKTAALVFPGGADLPFGRECKAALPAIRRYVSQLGGTYIGFCAGGYFGSSRVEFDVDGPLEVVGPRELQFFPDVARGPAFSGFQYSSEEGARAAMLKSSEAGAGSFACYYNGGSVFLDAHKYGNVSILASFEEEVDIPTDMEPAAPRAAVVLCSVGKGKALLTSPHPEFNPSSMCAAQDGLAPGLLAKLREHELSRAHFMRYILTEAGLDCNEAITRLPPSLTPLLLCSPSRPELVSRFVEGFKESSKPLATYHILEDNSDKFALHEGFERYSCAEGFLQDHDPETATKQLVLGAHGQVLPPRSLTPNFDMERYFASLEKDTGIGSVLLYGDVVTSTSVLLDSNKKLLGLLPENSVLHVGSLQLSGRGRGSNSWVNPRGVSASTTCISLPLVSPITGKHISIVFVQYLAILAYCEAILSYGSGFEDIPIRIKWPNDMYVLKPHYYYQNKLRLLGGGVNAKLPVPADAEESYAKISGLLVNSNLMNNKYSLLLGCGLNVSNELPTVSLKSWVDILNVERKNMGLNLLPELSAEELLAKYMNKLDIILKDFVNHGPHVILPRYYKLWMHSGQVITLTEHNCRAKISGITPDYGLLIANELKQNSNDEYTGKVYHLQPDGNTFDIFRGLLSRRAG